MIAQGEGGNFNFVSVDLERKDVSVLETVSRCLYLICVVRGPGTSSLFARCQPRSMTSERLANQLILFA